MYRTLNKWALLVVFLVLLGCSKEAPEPDRDPTEWVEIQVYSRYSLATVRINGDLPREAGSSDREHLTVLRTPHLISLVFERISGDHTTVTVVRYRGDTRSETEFGNVQFLRL